MKTYIINLDRRTDRMEEIKRQANIPYEYERFPATDGIVFLEEEKNKYMRGHLGCHDSHLRLLQKIYKDGDECVLVLEDDCDFVQKDLIIEDIVKQLPPDWDLLYLGGDVKESEAYSPNLLRVTSVLQTHAYIIRRKFIPTLVVELMKWKYKVDVVFSKALPKGNCFISIPHLAVQRMSFSDITHR